MLDREKLLAQLDLVSVDLFALCAQEHEVARQVWLSIHDDQSLVSKIQAKKWSMLVPWWQGSLGRSFPVNHQPHPYQVLAVDGSQIYYDKHQGPACYLINVGSVLLSYGSTRSNVQFTSQPTIIVMGDEQASDGQVSLGFAEQVNLKREEAELSEAVQQSITIAKQAHDQPFVCLFDGTLIFFQAEGQTERKELFFLRYMEQLELLRKHQVLHAGYVSFPRSKELVNVVKLVIAQFDEKLLAREQVLHRLTDMDVASFFLSPGFRSIIFQSKAPICYAYPKELKPYFCYLNVGFEIVRLEFPQWIACDEGLVDRLCAIALDQAQKGSGYPVCLFEAHEQAVVKSPDRDFFYLMVKKMAQKHSSFYQTSKKSIKKITLSI